MTCSHLTDLIIRTGHITLTDLITQAIQLRNGIKSEVDHTMVLYPFYGQPLFIIKNDDEKIRKSCNLGWDIDFF